MAALAFMAQHWLLDRRRRADEAAGGMLWSGSGRSHEKTVLRRLLLCGLFLMLAGQAPQWLDDARSRWEEQVSLSLLDVGQGQAALLEWPGGRILVDGGGSSSLYFDCGRSLVAPALTQGRQPRLEAVIVSHTDVDHARGLRWILEHFSVGTLYWSPVSAARADSGEGQVLRAIARSRGIPEKILYRGDTVELGHGLRLEVLAPDLAPGMPVPSEKLLTSNDASLVVRMVHDGHGLALLCGDMHAAALLRLAQSMQDIRAEALVLPHHGAASSFQKRFYDAVAPEAALASTASFNHYGFPSRRVRDEMARRDIPLFSTSDLGTVSLRWRKKDGRYQLDPPRQGRIGRRAE
jgi:competence protein ComEC